MNILIPMAGEGKRFVDSGITTHKPAIPTWNRHTGQLSPMVICATSDLPGITEDGSNIIYVDRDFHKADGVEDLIKETYPLAQFVTIANLTEGQACTCLMARELISGDEALFIAGCDNGMLYDVDRFMTLTQECDFIVFTFRGSRAVCEHPNAYGWVMTDGEDISGVSVKKTISDTPMEDHAIASSFWFRTGDIFIRAADDMISADDRIRNEFYVDQMIKYALRLGFRGKVFEIDRYIGWGTPEDHQEYQDTWEYWKSFWDLEEERGIWKSVK